MVVVSILPHAEFGPNDHRNDAPHSTKFSSQWSSFFKIFLDLPPSYEEVMRSKEKVLNQKLEIMRNQLETLEDYAQVGFLENLDLSLVNESLSNKAQRASTSYKIADCEISNSYLFTHKIFSSNRFFNFFWRALSFRSHLKTLHSGYKISLQPAGHYQGDNFTPRDKNKMAWSDNDTTMTSSWHHNDIIMTSQIQREWNWWVLSLLYTWVCFEAINWNCSSFIWLRTYDIIMSHNVWVIFDYSWYHHHRWYLLRQLHDRHLHQMTHSRNHRQSNRFRPS